ncbi:MAG: hypothetical protein AAB386_01235 [Patescibacteria group bacterium]
MANKREDRRSSGAPSQDREPKSLGTTELLRDLPIEAQCDAPAGSIIKDVGEDMPNALVMVRGLARVERDIMTPNGVRTVVVDSVNRDDLFNEGGLLPSLRENARQCRYVAETDCVYLSLTQQNFKGASNLPRALWAMLVAKIKRGASLQDVIATQLAERMNREPAPEGNGRDIAKMKAELQQLRDARKEDQREIARLGAEVNKLQVDQDWIAPSEKANALEREAARLREELSEAVLMANVNAAQAERLQSEALMKARDAWAELSRSEQVAGAVTEFSNFVFGLLEEAGASPTRAQVNEYRARIQEIHKLFSDEVCAELADDIGSLVDDDNPHTAQIFSVGEALMGNGLHDPDKPPETRRYREGFLSPKSGRAVTPDSSLPPPPEEDD